MYKVYCDEYLLYNPQIENLKIFNPRLDLEVNKTGNFSFLIYPEHPYFDRLEKLSSIIKVFRGNDLVFRGRILNDEEGFYNEKQVSCEGELAFLCDSIQRPYDFMSGENHTTVQDLFAFFIQNHNSQVEAEKRFIIGNITVTDPNNYIVRSDSTYLNTWDSINNKLIESYGGYLRVRHEQSGNYIDYLADFNVISNQTIEFGKNLLDFDKKIKGEQIVTAIIPLGAKEESGEQEEQALETRLTIADLPDDETGEICKKSDYVYSKSAVQRYGWIFKTITWDGVTHASNLQSKAEAELSQSINQAVTIELNGFDLSTLNQDVSGFKIGTYIRIKTAPHNINSNFLVKKLSIDLTNPAGNTLTLGATYLSFTERSNGKNNAILESVKTQIADTKTEINNNTNALIQELHIQEDRQAATLQNGWVNYGGGYESACFWKDKNNNVVHISGFIKSGSTDAETVLFTLPAGYRPRANEKVVTVSLNAFCVLDIYSSGNVVVKYGANSGWISLCNISFRAGD